MLRLLLAAGAASAKEWPCRLSKWDGVNGEATLKCDFGTGTRLRDCPLSDDQWAALGRLAKDLDTLGSAATVGACTVTCRMCDSWGKKWWSTSAYNVTCLQPNAETKPCDKLDIKSVVIKSLKKGKSYRHGAFGRKKKKMECKSGYQMNKSFQYVKCDGTKFVIKFQGQDEQEVSNSVSPCEKVTTTTTTTVKLIVPCENELQQCGRGFETYEQEDDPFFVEQECVLDACKEVAGKSCEYSDLAKAAHDAPPTCAHSDFLSAPGAVCKNGVWWIAKHGKEVPAGKFSEICKSYCGGNWGGRGKVLFGQPALCKGTDTPSGWTCGDDLFFVKGNERVQFFDETQGDCAGSTRLLWGGNWA